jgi:sucrose-6-phosphate hydrolase SacC (GH32 family)
MSNWFDYAQSTPTSTWRSSMTIPRDLWLKKTPDGYRVFQKPSPELQALVTRTSQTGEQVIGKDGWKMRVPVLHELDLHFDMKNCSATAYGYRLKNSRGEQVVITVDVAGKTVTVDRSASGKTSFSAEFPKKHSAQVSFSDIFRIRSYADASSLELFLDDGAACISETFFPNEDFSEVEFFAEGGSITLVPASSVNELKPVWNKQK